MRESESVRQKDRQSEELPKTETRTRHEHSRLQACNERARTFGRHSLASAPKHLLSHLSSLPYSLASRHRIPDPYTACHLHMLRINIVP